MARSTGWTFLWALVLGIVAASIFLLYGPYLEREINRRVAGALEKKEFTLQVGKGSEVAMAGAPARASGTRYVLISEGGKTFLADLQTGRVWRYFHYGRAEGWSKDVEGFAPLPFFQGNKKFFTAGEAAGAPEGGELKPQ
ncbi:MAG: hypothetical protein ACUVRZ_09370 [Desulfobacca sp.]|uniref:hypothetical protein n=1 Tax=Desulfobacca sp. TaxID=2067990 RepID=UPI00404A3CC6